jgi:photosystem II stability/assembly factor-like uncharacterized protein
MSRLPLRLVLLAVVAAAVAAGTIGFASQARSGEGVPLSKLPQVTHIHGMAVGAADPSQLLLATHHGFFVVTPDGVATRVSETRDDFMGFTPHPTEPSVFYASGHPERGGNLGFVASRDGGRTWRQLSKGVGGPVDFHQMDVSKADPQVIYGAYRGIQVSRDGGRTWRSVGGQPDGLIDLAASARDTETLYAATQSGLFVSGDGGRVWQPAYPLRRPASLVEVTADGRIYAFVVGSGLIRASEPRLDWETLADSFGEHIPIHLAADPVDEDRLYVATHHGAVLASEDGGRSWAAFAPR